MSQANVTASASFDCVGPVCPLCDHALGGCPCHPDDPPCACPPCVGCGRATALCECDVDGEDVHVCEPGYGCCQRGNTCYVCAVYGCDTCRDGGV